METSIFESPTPLSETALLLRITGAPTTPTPRALTPPPRDDAAAVRCQFLLDHRRTNTRQAESPVRRLLRKSAPGLTRSCAPESTSVCGDVGEVDPQSTPRVAAARGRPAAAGQGAGLIRAELRSAQ